MQADTELSATACEIPGSSRVAVKRVSHLMREDVRHIAPESRLREVVLELADAHVTALAVLETGGRLVGVISTTDILQAQAEHEDGAWGELRVDDVMTRPALTIGPDAPVTEATQLMLYRDVHRLFVVVGERVVGVISQTDIVRALGARRLVA